MARTASDEMHTAWQDWGGQPSSIDFQGAATTDFGGEYPSVPVANNIVIPDGVPIHKVGSQWVLDDPFVTGSSTWFPSSTVPASAQGANDSSASPSPGSEVESTGFSYPTVPPTSQFTVPDGIPIHKIDTPDGAKWVLDDSVINTGPTPNFDFFAPSAAAFAAASAAAGANATPNPLTLPPSSGENPLYDSYGPHMAHPSSESTQGTGGTSNPAGPTDSEGSHTSAGTADYTTLGTDANTLHGGYNSAGYAFGDWHLI